MSPGRPPRIKGFAYVGVYRYSLCFVVSGRTELFRVAALVATSLTQIRRTCDEERFELLAYCFMPDHLHLVVEGLSDSSDLARLVKLAKQRSGFAARTTLGIPLTWQEEYYDRVLRSEEATDVVVRYVLDNPVRVRLVRNAEDYAFSGARYWPEAM